MRQKMRLVCFVLTALASNVAAQGPKTPKPGPEIDRLQYFVGTWKSEYELKPSPMGAGGKVTGVDESRMMPGGFFVETRTVTRGSMGDIQELAVMGYDAEAKAYTYDAFSSVGGAQHFKGAVQGDTWTWTSDGMVGGKPTRMRFIAKEVSPKMYTQKLEIAAGGDWTTVMEGKATKKSAKTKPKTK